MADKRKAFKNWQDWATTDWREFSYFFVKKHGVEAFNKASAEFAKQMQVSTHAMLEITNIALGKGIEYGVSSSLSSILSIADILSRLAGIGYYKVSQIKDNTRYNPHTLVQTSVWSDDYTFKESELPDYVKYILYCYPKDLDNGWYGFRYGSESPTQGCSMLRKTKEISRMYYGR